MATRPPISDLLDSGRPGEAPGVESSPDAGAHGFSFVIEDAPPTSGTAERIGRELRLLQDVEGRVTNASDGHLDLLSDVGVTRVRIELPEGVSLEPLLDQEIRMQITRRYGGVMSVDAQIRCARFGRLIFWARDGQWPDGPPDGLTIQPRGERLEFSIDDVSIQLTSGEKRSLSIGRASWVLAVFAAAADRCAFILTRETVPED